MEEESLKNFINSIIFLVKLFAGLKDKFLAQKLYDKISGFIAGYIRLFNSKGEDAHMSHNAALRSLLNSLDSLLELLDYLEHSKSVSTTPLLYARKNLLNFKLDLVKLHHQPVQTAPKPKENKSAVIISKNIHQPRNLKESSNKKKIFNFIKHSPNSRTKEIIEEFNILSKRTVKRNLKELITEGLVRKFAKDKGIYYSTT
ncbi:MAG: helix-turn-helix domain-containing protein [Patescibacteria group bacterium]